MSKQIRLKITPRPFDTYLAVIKNSIGSNMFRNLYVNINGVKKDATEDGKREVEMILWNKKIHD